ncbi:MAG: arnT 3 [Gammaproteobacteria bacterium]|nr:arnT 3 [Gammaproteobacteria bacterium]
MFATYKNQPTQSWLIDLFFITLTIGIFYMLFLGTHPLFTPDEGRYSEVAREMIVTGDYITPRLNGVVFLDKPVFYYWLQASSIALFGLKEWALRFWPSLIGVLGCVMTYFSGRLLFTRRAGILSAIILATNPLYYGAAHYANLDLEVAVFISNTLLFILLGTQTSFSNRSRTLFLMFAYLFAGLAALTKGLIGLVFPILITGSWIILLNRWRLLRQMHLIAGLLIFTAITVPWYFLVQKANPQFFHFFFITQQWARFLTKADFNNPSPVWFYIPILLAGFFPWSVFLIQALSQQIKLVFKNHQQHASLVFLLLWSLIVFVFFSIPKSKTIGYILPLFPALALLVGNYLSNRWEKPYKTKKLFSYFTFIAIVCLLVLQFSAGSINQKTIKPLALQLKSIATKQDEIITFYRYYQDLPIYLERRITIVADWHAPDIVHNDNWVRELWFGMPFQNTADWLIEEPTFWQRWKSHKRVFVLMNARDYADFNKKARHQSYQLNTYNDVVLISNRKV